MFKLRLAVFVLVLAALVAPIRALAEGYVALSALADDLKMSYQYLQSSGTAVLARSGLTIAIRPGDRVVEVGESAVVASHVPFFMRDAVYISPDLAAVLRQIAARTPVAPGKAQQAIPAYTPGPRPGTDSEGPLSLVARPALGVDASVLWGNGPPNTTIDIAEYAFVSSDLPNILLGRYSAQTDSEGRFVATIAHPTLNTREAILRFKAATPSGVWTAQAETKIKPANFGKVGVDDQWPSR